ncbi:FkbM family methyltransferase [Segetibacter aerophilus]|uniref:FkbM family methyltransferase n=1 Tax=Segetibacter aerophilus TaxID=670293 RepID=A0A512B7R7_9BACT|nr:FkbM family methyltransferase [Segetibacter aerophilus]GEO08022.1 FkbM family methyltransferase [Segetibacter aerophilus]
MDKLVYDIGMHIGQDTRYYLKKGFRVLAIEANPELVEEARKNLCKYTASGQLIILNVCIAQSEGVRPFYKNLRCSEWSSFDKSIGSRNETRYEVLNVECITTKKLFETYGMPYYLKIDIEGYDYMCLLDIPDNGNKPQYVSCEACHLEWLDILKSKGYQKFKLISQGDNFIQIDLDKEKKFYYPKYQVVRNGIKLRLQRFISFKHLYGSSGPFGDDTKGEWKSYEQVKSLFEKYNCTQSAKPLNNVSWFDFHASL